MQINVENISSVKHRIRISVDSQRVTESRNKLFTTLKKQVVLRGFRPGHAPMNILKRRFGDQVDEEVKGELLQEALDKAVKDNNLKLVARPEIESSEFGEDGGYNAVATVEVSPAIEPKDYKGISVKRKKAEVAEEAVQARLEEFARMRASIKTIEEERPAQTGDFVEIDYEGKREGQTFEGGSAENYLLEIGSKSFIPGFEEAVAGMRAGEEKDIDLTFPENYDKKEMAGKAVVFHVKLKAIKQRVIPALDDDFAKEVSDKFETLAELRAKQRENLEEEAKRVAAEFDRDQAVKALLAVNEFDVPESMVANQTSYLVERMRQNLSYSGFQRQDLDALMEGAAERMRPEGLKDVKAMLLLEAIAEKEGLECLESDLQAKYAELAARVNRSPLEISAEYQKEEGRLDNLKFSIRQDKTLEFLMSNAQVEWVGADYVEPHEHEEHEGHEHHEDEPEEPAEVAPAEEAAEKKEE